MKIFSLFLILLVLSSCSRLDLAVSFAPRYISNELDDALDLDSDRYKRIKNAIASDLEKNKLPLFTEIISQIDHLLILTEKKEISADEISFIFLELKSLQKKAVYSFKPSFSEVILPITKSEIKNLAQYMTNKVSKADEVMADRSKFYRHYFKSYDHYVDQLFDSSSKEQDRLFREFLDANMSYYKSRNQSRLSMLKQFDTLFSQKEELLDFNLKFYAGESTTKSEDFVKKQDAFNRSTQAFVARFWNGASMSQRNHFRKYLQEIKEELKKIIALE